MMIDERITAIEAMEPEIVGGAVLGVTAIFLTFAVIALIRYLMQAIGYSKMYRKAGVAGWKAFIPVYNSYNNYKISWNGKMFALAVALYILMGASNSSMLALQLAAAAAAIALLVVVVKQNIKMANHFGKGTGTGIALIFFPGITSLILGLGKAEFQK